MICFCMPEWKGPSQYYVLSDYLVPLTLVDTAYAEVGIWALFVIYSTILSSSLAAGLKLLLANLSLTEWSQVSQAMLWR